LARGRGRIRVADGCGTYADFGRVRPSLVNDDTHAWMGPAVARGPATNLAWKHQLTEEERMLRDLAIR
jgi:hypothetical protein